MTVGLVNWLRIVASLIRREAPGRFPAAIDPARLPARDRADLNLPPEVLARLAAREAQEDRMRMWR